MRLRMAAALMMGAGAVATGAGQLPEGGAVQAALVVAAQAEVVAVAQAEVAGADVHAQGSLVAAAPGRHRILLGLLLVMEATATARVTPRKRNRRNRRLRE